MPICKTLNEVSFLLSILTTEKYPLSKSNMGGGGQNPHSLFCEKNNAFESSAMRLQQPELAKASEHYSLFSKKIALCVSMEFSC